MKCTSAGYVVRFFLHGLIFLPCQQDAVGESGGFACFAWFFYSMSELLCYCSDIGPSYAAAGQPSLGKKRVHLY
jgi:hypothetical protein